MTRKGDEFGRRLREAGAAVTPGVSEELHARVMGAVRRERAKEMAAAERSAGAWWMVVAGAGVAAAIVVVVWVGRTGERERVDRPVAVAELPVVPSIEAVVAERVEPVREKLHEARFAYLDRDAKRLGRFLWRSVPGVAVEKG